MMVNVEIPDALWEAFSKRAKSHGIVPGRLVASLILSHINSRGPGNFGRGMVANLMYWERGKRTIRKWPEAAAVVTVR